MLLTFSVYSAQNLDVAEEIAKKVIRDFLIERKKLDYTLEVLNVSGHAADLDFATYGFNVKFQANINANPLHDSKLRLVG